MKFVLSSEHSRTTVHEVTAPVALTPNAKDFKGPVETFTVVPFEAVVNVSARVENAVVVVTGKAV